MTPKILLTCVAVAGLTAGAAQAATHHVRAHKAGAYAEPAQPIPYAELNAYLKASPRQRLARNWSAGAATGASVDTSATTPAAPMTASPDAATTSQAPNAAVPPPVTGNPDTEAAPMQPPANAPAPDATQPPAAPATQPAQ